MELEGDTVFLSTRGCTEICCDDRVGKLYKELNYNDKFSFTNFGKRLILENAQEAYYLMRQ